MIANLINQVLQAMSKTLGNQEIERLKDVLEITFSNVEIFEKTGSDAAIEMSVIKTFLSAKRVEGCSEKSMRYYESTIRNALATVGKMSRMYPPMIFANTSTNTSNEVEHPG